MKIEIFEKRAEELEKEMSSLYSGVERYKIYDFFKQVKKLLEYRKIKPFIDIKDDGHEFRCQGCGVLMISQNRYDEFEVCPLCGQRVAEKGSCYIVEDGKAYGKENI